MDAILRQRRTGDGEWSGERKEAFGLRVAPWPDCNQHNIHPPRRRARGLPIHPPPIASKVATAAMAAICLAVAAPVPALDPLILLPSWKCDG